MKRLALLAVAVASAVAAPAMAETIRYYGNAAPVTTYVWDPATGKYVEHEAIVYDEVTAPAPTVTYTPSVTYSDPVTYTPPVTYSAPATYATYGTPRDVTYNDEIVVVAPRSSRDDLISADVEDRIASDPRIGGVIGVDTYRSNVTLTGRVATEAQKERAQRHAQAVDGVRDVNNEIRSSVGNF